MFKHFRKKKKLTSRIGRLFQKGPDTQGFYEELEDALIEADIKASIAMDISDELRNSSQAGKISSPEELRIFVRDVISRMILTVDLDPRQEDNVIYLVLGVNGVGKTTSMAKLARRWLDAGRNVSFAAGDTFRAAAVEQLGVHAQRLGVKIFQQGQGADPSAVIFDGLESIKAKGEGILLADTAGRMHNKSQLVKELQKIDRVIRSKVDDPSYRRILVIDATTGQNGIQQAEVFHEAVGIDGIILSKYDSRARGGLALSISRTLGIPFAYMGTGERYEDIRPMDADALVDSIMSAIEG